MVNVNGYNSCKCTEKKIAKAAARLAHAFANADVPKVTVIAGQAFGTAGLVMNSKSIGSDIVYAWKNASIGMMEAVPAVKIMEMPVTQEEFLTFEGKYTRNAKGAGGMASQVRVIPAPISEKAAQYSELQASAMAAARRGYVDDIIDAADTRKRVIAAMEMLFTKREDRPAKKHGTV